MKNSLYNRQHLKEYFYYGLAAALVYMIPVWVYLVLQEYKYTWMVLLGSILFMFVILVYSYRLSRRKTEQESTWMMIIAACFAVLTGIVLSVLLTLLLCAIYLPGFFSNGGGTNVLEKAPAGLNKHNSSLLWLLFICATVENFGAGGIMALLGPYIFKKNQTRDRSAQLEKSIELP